MESQEETERLPKPSRKEYTLLFVISLLVIAVLLFNVQSVLMLLALIVGGAIACYVAFRIVLYFFSFLLVIAGFAILLSALGWLLHYADSFPNF